MNKIFCRVLVEVGRKNFLRAQAICPVLVQIKFVYYVKLYLDFHATMHNIEQLIFRRGGAIIPQGNFLILELVKCHFQHFRCYTCILMRFDDFK